MDAQLKELLPFLHDRNPQVRQIALSNLLGQSAKDAPYRKIFLEGVSSGGLKKGQDTDVIRDLKLLCRDQLATAHDAFRALVNLSDSALLVPSLSEHDFLAFIVSYIVHPQATLADLASMLLSNLTASGPVCATLLSLKIPIIPTKGSSAVGIPFYPTLSRCGSCAAPVPYPADAPEEVLALPLLIDAFVAAAAAATKSADDSNSRTRKADLHFLASVFANISIVPAGRTFFLTPIRYQFAASNISDGPEYPLSKLVAFTEHTDIIRRGGTASLIKNCAFYQPGHRAMLSEQTTLVTVPPSTVEAPGVDALAYILLPLAGPEELDLDEQELLPEALQFLPESKKREPDPAIRLIHVETLLLLCTTRYGRDKLRSTGTYQIVRLLHENETVDKVSEHVERLVRLLKGDEGHENAIDGDGVPPGETDDADNRIEEI
ncbi:cytoplasmic protein [Punctularia strigosozonata HHB-11173 SS5]|uniref:cytoplasmic protein n=1 Tax=Punctularia strigosozonata (strain HHB-11173) TaxID=741275 RepID=UPI0004416791|nr:cytoplasmic protein [Punctularia strigosozonata HHB-11173 SS5]EIN09451.1 cytoplasmic protein [Punctularia strigosozonata HHB-11173 SS5]